MSTRPSPLIELPFTPRMNSQVDHVEAHVRSWSREFGLVRTETEARRLARSHVGHFAAYAYPDAPLSRVKLASEFFQWLYVADDQYESGSAGSAQAWSAAIETVRRVLDPAFPYPSESSGPLVRALSHVSAQLDRITSPTWKRRFSKNIVDTLVAALREIEMRDKKAVLSVEEYIPLRRMSGGCVPCLDLIEPCADLELPDEVYYSDYYQEIFQTAVDVVCWTNDLYSLDKEIACGITTNLVLVLMTAYGVDQDQAVVMTRSMIMDAANRMLAVQQALPEHVESVGLESESAAALRFCVQALLTWVAGSNSWHASGTAHLEAAAPGELPEDDLFLSTG